MAKEGLTAILFTELDRDFDEMRMHILQYEIDVLLASERISKVAIPDFLNNLQYYDLQNCETFEVKQEEFWNKLGSAIINYAGRDLALVTRDMPYLNPSSIRTYVDHVNKSAKDYDLIIQFVKKEGLGKKKEESGVMDGVFHILRTKNLPEEALELAQFLHTTDKDETGILLEAKKRFPQYLKAFASVIQGMMEGTMFDCNMREQIAATGIKTAYTHTYQDRFAESIDFSKIEKTHDYITLKKNLKMIEAQKFNN